MIDEQKKEGPIIFNDTLLYSVNYTPEKRVYTQLDLNGEEVASITYQELYANSAVVAKKLLNNYKKGDRCLIAVSPGVEFIIAFFACLLSGVIAVPVSIPGKNKKNLRFWSIIEDANPECILVDNKTESLLQSILESAENLERGPELHKVEQDKYDSIKFDLPKISSNDTAFIQYTSGSVSVPKGVLVSHGNLLHNSEIIKQSFNHDPDLVVCSWLPQYHDMGLIGCVLQPVYVGGSCVLIKPVDFIKNPTVWFEAISKYRATTVGCPNFALDYCVEKISQPESMKIDLSCLKVMFSGSEPVRKNSLQAFSEKFKPLKFKPQMFLPCYGLAEATLMVSGIHQIDIPEYNSLAGQISEFNESNSSEPKEIFYTSCGQTWNDTDILIVDPETKEVAGEGDIGEIWVKNDSVCGGYYNNAELTREVFKALTNKGEGPFLRTGDLGFLKSDKLHVTGRLKDMIILRGENYFPSDIEEAVNDCHPALMSNRCAAFSVNDEKSEKLVIVQEIKRTYIDYPDKEEIYRNIISAIADNFEAMVSSIVLIKPMSIPKTTSGKIQRLVCRKMYNEGLLHVVSDWENVLPSDDNVTGNNITEYTVEDMKLWLKTWLGNKLNIDPESINDDQPVLSLGLDSIGAVDLECDMNLEFGSNVFIGDFLENNTIDYLVRASLENQE